MATIALLGATGTIGSRVLAILLEETRFQIHCSVRSKTKLQQQLSTGSNSETFPTRIKIFEGSVSDGEALRKCLDGASVVIMCAAASSNIPGCSIAQDQATAIINTLQSIRSARPETRMPKLVMLSSAETETKFIELYPWLMSTMLFKSNSYIYEDLIAAERYLRDQEDFVSTVYVKPGGLSHDIRRGHVISEEKDQTFLSFQDLAAGMVEVAETAIEGEKWDGKVVSVLSPSGKAKIEYSAIPLLFKGLLIHYFPWLYAYIG